MNIPGTRVGPGGRDQMMTNNDFLPKILLIFSVRLLHIPSTQVEYQLPGTTPEVGEKQYMERNKELILQGLRVAQAAVTKRWP